MDREKHRVSRRRCRAGSWQVVSKIGPKRHRRLEFFQSFEKLGVDTIKHR
jgi:hypothetical protein